MELLIKISRMKEYDLFHPKITVATLPNISKTPKICAMIKIQALISLNENYKLQ